MEFYQSLYPQLWRLPLLIRHHPIQISMYICEKMHYMGLSIYEGHSVNSEIRCVSVIAYLLAESWCCLYKAPTFISHNTKETIS